MTEARCSVKQQAELYLRAYEEQLCKAAKEIKHQNMPEITEELFSLYEKEGNRIQYEAVYFERRRFLNIYAMNSLLYHREEDICKLEEIVRNICAEECWALPAHVDRKNNKDWRITIELFASETGQALTEIAELLEGVLDADVIALIEENVTKRVLKPFYESVIPYDKWEGCEMNWCAVCAGCIGSISIYYFRHTPALLEDCLQRINLALQGYIRGFTADGVCAEGLDYWTYGMYYYVMYARKLKAYTNGRINLLEGNKLKNILTFQQKCYFSDGTSISFSDGSLHSRFRMGLTAFLVGSYKQVHFPDMKNVMQLGEDECNRWAPAYRDYIWTKEYIEKQAKEEMKNCENRGKTEKCSKTDSYALKSAQWMICNGNSSGMAVKGGNNDEPHNHNDIGNFIYLYKGIEFLVDLGAGEYCRDYFNENRYTIFCNTSESHNVPILNNRLQEAGKQYCCSGFKTNGKDCAVLEFAGAYEAGLVEKIERQLHFDNIDGELQVCDSFVISEKTESIQENLVTRQAVSVEGNVCFLNENGIRCKIVIDTVPARELSIEVIEKIHINHTGQEEQIHLIRWTVFSVQNDSSLAEGRVICSFRIIPE